jgi:hypothetical protein
MPAGENGFVIIEVLPAFYAISARKSSPSTSPDFPHGVANHGLPV